MGFKENLKTELAYQGILIKELAEKSGISRRTIDNYLNAQNSMPLADVAVAIAKTLGVTVEQLVTGEDRSREKATPFPKPDERLILQIYKELEESERDTLLKIAKVLKKQSKKMTGPAG
jgi:transcriptional regulator with XRE-family HTH domain